VGKPTTKLIEKISNNFFRSLELSSYNGYRTLRYPFFSERRGEKTDFVFLPLSEPTEQLKDFIFDCIQCELSYVYNINDRESLDRIYDSVMVLICEELYE
jgi:hypothetical protein